MCSTVNIVNPPCRVHFVGYTEFPLCFLLCLHLATQREPHNTSFYKLSIYKNEVMWFPTLFYYSALLPPLPPVCLLEQRVSLCQQRTQLSEEWWNYISGQGKWQDGGDGEAKWEGGRVHSASLWGRGKFYYSYNRAIFHLHLYQSVIQFLLLSFLLSSLKMA